MPIPRTCYRCKHPLTRERYACGCEAIRCTSGCDQDWIDVTPSGEIGASDADHWRKGCILQASVDWGIAAPIATFAV